jgi:hypothetical protein
MNDCVIDTNVLLVASAAHPYSPFSDSHVPLSEQRKVLDWLKEFRVDASRRLVLDGSSLIYQEYRNKLTDQDYGLQVVHEKMQDLRSVDLDWDGDDNAIVPKAFSEIDRSDRKFLATALTEPSAIMIVNATDSDWLEFEHELGVAGVPILHIIEAWLRASLKADH